MAHYIVSAKSAKTGHIHYAQGKRITADTPEMALDAILQQTLGQLSRKNPLAIIATVTDVTDKKNLTETSHHRFY